jgi:hypothetical protein
MFSKEMPTLIEPGTKYFLRETLRNCNNKKVYYYSLIFNLVCFFIFFGILVTFLYYRKKTKLTPKEKEKMKIKEQEYIMTKLKNFNEEAQRQHNLLITNLPRFEQKLSNNYEKMHKNYYKV